MILRIRWSIITTMTVLAAIAQRGWCIPEEVMSCLRQERANFENPSQNMVSVVAQQPAYLHCRVPEGSKHMVAWTRASDQALLTAGEETFTEDPRFQVSKKSDDDWVLIIRRTETTDAGCYLCEINSEPTSTVYAVYLDVRDPPPVATGSRRSTKLMANMAGDEVLLNCTIQLGSASSEQAAAEEDVVWTRDGQTIDLNNTQKYVLKVKRAAGVVVHTMRIRSATMDDDGDYSCGNEVQKASQIVHVNSPEAQRGSGSGTFSAITFITTPFLFILLRLMQPFTFLCTISL